MRRLSEHLLSSDFWVGCIAFLAVVGLLLCAVGFLAPSRRLVIIGLWFSAPLILSGIILLVVVIPILIVANWKHRK